MKNKKKEPENEMPIKTKMFEKKLLIPFLFMAINFWLGYEIQMNTNKNESTKKFGTLRKDEMIRKQ